MRRGIGTGRWVRCMAGRRGIGTRRWVRCMTGRRGIVKDWGWGVGQICDLEKRN